MDYTAGSSSMINRTLRKCPETFDCLDPSFAPQIRRQSAELSEAISKAPPLPEGTELYRGVSFGDISDEDKGKFLSNFRQGRTLSLGGFSSTTLDYKTAQAFGGGEIMLKIKAKTGLYVGDVSAYKHDEREILQNQSTRYRVAGQGINKELTRYVIELEEI